MSRLISFVLAYLSSEPRDESRNYKMIFFTTAGLEPIASCLLDWCSNRLCHEDRSDCRHLKVNNIHVNIDMR